MEVPSNKLGAFPEEKKTLKRPPFSKGYPNLKPKIQKQPFQSIPVEKSSKKEAFVKYTAPSFKRNPLVTKRRSSILAQNRTFQRTNVQQRNIPKTNASNYHRTKVPGPKVETTVKPVVEIPDLNSELWQLIVQWCQAHKRSLKDFSNFSSSSQPALGVSKTNAFRPACKNILEKYSPTIEKRLETLLTYFNKENFPASLLFAYLSKQSDQCTHLKDYSLFWVILVECKLSERLLDDVCQLLRDAYKCKAKPPSRLIECYQTFVDLLMETFVHTNGIVPKEGILKNIKTEEERLEPIFTNVTDENVELTQKIERTDEPNATQEEPAILLSTTTLVEKEFLPLTNESSDINQSSEQFFTPRRKSVAFADPIFAEVNQMNLATPMQPETLDMDLLGDSIVINQFENNFVNQESEFSTVADSAKLTANRRTDLFDHSQIFLSSQRKYALFMENNENCPGSKPFVTPVRRSTRVDQENLPVELREKLTLFDSLAEIEAEKCEVRRNPALRASFGGKMIQETLDSLEKD